MAGHDSAALVLNASYEPLCVVSSRRAVVLGKIVPGANFPELMRSIWR